MIELQRYLDLEVIAIMTWKKISEERPILTRVDSIIEENAPEIRLMESVPLLVRRDGEYAVAVYTEVYEEPEHILADGGAVWQIKGFDKFLDAGVMVEDGDEWREIE